MLTKNDIAKHGNPLKTNIVHSIPLDTDGANRRRSIRHHSSGRMATSLLRYPGSKSRVADYLSRRLMAHGDLSKQQFREPFVGSGSVAHAVLPHASSIWLNDKDESMAAVHTAIMRLPEELKARILDFVPCLDSFNRIHTLAKSGLGSSDISDMAIDKIAVHRMSYSGYGMMGGPMSDIDSRWNPESMCLLIDHLHELYSGVDIHERQCTSLDFEHLILDDSKQALLYLDPPYVDKSQALYVHSFIERDHVRLADALRQSPHRWMMTYDDHEMVRSLYSGWAEIETLVVPYSNREQRHATELLISSR